MLYYLTRKKTHEAIDHDLEATEEVAGLAVREGEFVII